MKVIFNRKAITIILSTIGLLFLTVVGLYFFYGDNKNSLDTQYVALGKKVVLHKNQSAIIKDEDLEIKVLEFYNSPCPKGIMCFWSGIGVSLEYMHGSEVKRGINLVKAFGYQTDIIATDYETYIKLRVTKIGETQY